MGTTESGHGMNASSSRGLREAISTVLSDDDDGLTARVLVYRLRALGWDGIDKSTVNSVLYRAKNHFQKDASSPPRWLLAQDDLPADDGEQRAASLAAIMAHNWKSLRDDNLVVFAGISLFFGANSSGKTSLLQSLLLLQQSWGSAQFVYEGSSATCESFRNVVHNHETRRHVLLGLMTVGHSSPGRVDHYSRVSRWDESAEAEGAHTIVLMIADRAVSFTLAHGQGGNHWVAEGPSAVDFAEALGAPSRDPEVARVYFFDVNEQGWPGDLVAVNADDEFEEVPFRLSRRWDQWSRQSRQTIESTLSRVEHLGPMRAVPARWVSQDLSDEPDGSDVIRRLQEHDLREDVNEWLDRLEIPYLVDVEEAESEEGAPRLALVLSRRGASEERVRLQDVGYGISQVLPLVVMSLAGRERIIVVEQPEVHLHPRLQSRLADLLVTSAQDYGNQLLVETHSEHLLLRLQRRIAEKRLDHEDLVVYYVTRPSSAAEIERVEIDDDGHMVGGWPAGFFDNRLEDMVAIASPGAEP